MDISIVIPVHNERDKIANDIRNAADFLEQNFEQSEIIIADDGSYDDTASIARETEVPNRVSKIVVRNIDHRGKGSAVRTGMVSSIGEIAMFADSGQCCSFGNILKGLKLLNESQCDLAHGSRFLPESTIVKPHIRSRRVTSWLFRNLLNYWIDIPRHLTDTQCGFKMYRGDVARKLYSQCKTDGFMFDIEIVLRAVREGYVIKEFPITWTADHDSRLSQLRTPMRAIKELRRIRRMFK